MRDRKIFGPGGAFLNATAALSEDNVEDVHARECLPGLAQQESFSFERK